MCSQNRAGSKCQSTLRRIDLVEGASCGAVVDASGDVVVEIPVVFSSITGPLHTSSLERSYYEHGSAHGYVVSSVYIGHPMQRSEVLILPWNVGTKADCSPVADYLEIIPVP